MRVFITGCCGFLGSHLCDALLAEGHTVAGNDSLICGDMDNLPNGVLYHGTDCCNFDGMKADLERFKPDVVIHAAATAHEGYSSFSPSFITRNIYEASVSTFSAAIASGVKRIVYMSSMSRYGKGRCESPEGGMQDFVEPYEFNGRMYGPFNGPPFTEKYHVPAPVDPYAISKVAAEDTLRILCNTHGVKYSILIPHNIIGTRQRSTDPYRNVASIMINRCKQGKQPIVYGDGSQTRCFSPVKDCLPSIIKAVNGDADGEIVNIGPDEGTITILDLANKVIGLTGFNGGIHFVPGRPNEVKHATCSSVKARQLLGYVPKQSIDDCLKEMVDFIKPAPFEYSFPLEITSDLCPKTWKDKLI